MKLGDKHRYHRLTSFSFFKIHHIFGTTRGENCNLLWSRKFHIFESHRSSAFTCHCLQNFPHL